MSEGTRKRRWFRFSLRTLLVAAVVLSIAIAILNHLRLNNPDGFRELASWTIVVTVALVLRPLGAWMGRPIGHVAHHSLAWFAATLGAASGILAVNAVTSPDVFFRDIPDGLGAASLIYGIAVGALVELGFVLIRLVRTVVG
jgi:hypothetical protein